MRQIEIGIVVVVCGEIIRITIARKHIHLREGSGQFVVQFGQNLARILLALNLRCVSKSSKRFDSLNQEVNNFHFLDVLGFKGLSHDLQRRVESRDNEIDADELHAESEGEEEQGRNHTVKLLKALELEHSNAPDEQRVQTLDKARELIAE